MIMIPSIFLAMGVGAAFVLLSLFVRWSERRQQS